MNSDPGTVALPSSSEEGRQAVIDKERQHQLGNLQQALSVVAYRAHISARSPTEFQEFFGLGMRTAFNLLDINNLVGQACSVPDMLKKLTSHLLLENSSRLVGEGPDRPFDHRHARPLALALRELVTNSFKHGALSNDVGQVFVRWAVKPDKLILTWKEIGGPPVSKPTSHGGGTALFDLDLPASFEVDCNISWPVEGLSATFSFPLSDDRHVPVGDLSRPTILIADDDANALWSSFVGDLKDEGHHVTVLESIEELTEFVDSHKPIAFAVLDLLLHGKRSLSLAKALDQRGVFVVLATGRHEFINEFDASEYSHLRFLQKPFEMSELEGLISGKLPSPDNTIKQTPASSTIVNLRNNGSGTPEN